MKTVKPSTPAVSSAHHNAASSESSGIPVPITYPSDSGQRSCISPLNKAAEAAEATSQLMIASDGSWGDHSDKHEDSTSSKLHNKTSSISEDMVTVLSRNGSLSSLSVDSFGSTEPTPSEQALLEQCISSGMPKSKSEGGCGKARIAVPVSTKKKISGGVCKIPLATGDHRRPEDEERQGPVIPSVPLQKLELKPVVRTHSGSNTGVVGTIEDGMACLNLQDDANARFYDITQIPKNGVDPSAVLSLTETAADVDKSIAAIGSMQNLQNHFKITKDLPENRGIAETGSSHVSASSLANKALSTDYGLNKEDVNDKDVFRKPAIPEESQGRFDMKLEVCKGASGVSCLGNKIDSPHESTSDDNKSPFSSGESPIDCGSDGRMEDCDRKRKDPDAMIASLDRLTEELVQQAQDIHLQKEKSKDSGIMKQSLVGSDTWNEDMSPNDVSFPSMSISAPLVASFRSDNHEDGTVALPELAEEADLISKTSEEQQGSSLTDSRMIEVEAGKLAVAVQAEGQNLPYISAEEMEHSLTSLNSVDLDAIKPPSMMGSLVSLSTSLSGQLDCGESGETREHCNSSSLPPPQPRNNGTRLECRHSRKKSLPAGMMVRRALGNNNHNGSIENLQDNTSVSSSCNSHLDNIKPPSAMEEFIDIIDMENSMVSVASITSEVADTSTKEQSTSEQSAANSDGIFELLKPAASIMAEVYAAHYPAAAMSASVRTSSASDCLDNINPPSAFNDVADLADPESAMELGTETICSDTEMYTEEPGYAHSMEKLDEVDAPDLPSDTSRKATPVPSDQYMTSSAESTPKKHKQLTPKQKRQLVKERYKTYTITTEEEREKLINTECENSGKMLPSDPEVAMQVLEAAACDSIREPENSEHPMQEEENEVKEKGHNKMTPKQRRLEDRQRFQTRVLDKSPSVDIKHEVGSVETKGDTGQEERPECTNIDLAKRKTSKVKTLKQKRAEAKERFQTRTLSEESKPQQNSESHNCNEANNAGIQNNLGAETLAQNCSDVGFVEALLNVTPEEIESLLERDANIVITTLNDSRWHNSESSELPSSDDMLLECETLSLISIESESDQNSVCRIGKRRGSDLTGRESSVSEEPRILKTEVFLESSVEENVSEKVEVDIEDRESVDDGEESQEDEDYGDDGVPKMRGPRIVKPEERLKQDESADSNCTDEGTPQSNSPKPIRGRRKALYSSPAAKKLAAPPPGLPVAGKVRSSIPVMSGAATNVRPTRASVLRQTGRGSSTITSHQSVSRTPPPSTGSRSPRNASPKTSRTGRTQQRNPNNASPPAKTKTLRNSGTIRTPGKESDERDVKDPRFKPPERQGTFTKDETNSIMPKVVPPPSPTRTRIPVPASGPSATAKFESKSKKTSGATKPSPSVSSTTSRTKIPKETSAPTPLTRSLAQNRFTKNCSQENSASGKGSPTGNLKSLMKAATIPGQNGTTRSPPSYRVGYKRGSIGAQEGMKTSLSNQSLQSNDSGKTTPKQGAIRPQRSNSNCSLNSVASGGVSCRKSNTKKEVTSKIANLWKRVEENKSKQKAAKKDTRVWITATCDEAVNAANDNDGYVVSTDVPPISRLVRSSTFEGLPSKSASNDEIDQNAKIGTETAKANKTKIKMRFLKHTEKCETKGIRNSGDFTGFVTNQEPSSKSSHAHRQVAEVMGVVIVHPTSKVVTASELHHVYKGQDEIPTHEVVLRRPHSETKAKGSENIDPDSEKPKRLSRLGSFIRIDPSEEGIVSTGDSKNLSKPLASAIVQPFNYNPPASMVGSHIPTPVTSIAKRSESYLSGVGNIEEMRHDQAEVLDEHMQEFNTASMRVTTV
jgi:adenomatosis polyposis coli protein